MRFQHGVDDNPTRLPISATDSDESSCRRARILRSVASIVLTSNGKKARPSRDPERARPRNLCYLLIGSISHIEKYSPSGNRFLFGLRRGPLRSHGGFCPIGGIAKLRSQRTGGPHTC